MLYRFYLRLQHIFYRICTKLVFGETGKKSVVIAPMRVLGGGNIILGDNVSILNEARLEAITGHGNETFNGKLIIGSGTSIEQNCHIIAADELTIGERCMFSAYIYIADCNHHYAIGQDIHKTGLEIKKTKIGDDVFIGIGAKIMPGVTIGNNCIIGANSVVTKDIPNYCIAAGIPAKIIKKYNFQTSNWEKIS